LEEASARREAVRRLSAAWRRPLSAKHERAALTHLLTLIDAEIAGQVTTLEDDQRLLSEAGLAPRMRAALLYRIGRKAILAKQVELIHRALDALSLTKQDDELHEA